MIVGPLALALLQSAEPAQEVPRFREDVLVERVLVDARVVDSRGAPILGLEPGDFRVRVGGEQAQVESVVWVGGAPAPEAPKPSEAAAAAEPPPPAAPGRLVVFFFQKSLDASRAPGLIKMLRDAGKLVDQLAPEDRVAVLSFDSHLKLWVDFGDSREAVQHALRRSVLFEDRPEPLPAGPAPSLATHFDFTAARKAALAETALLVIARALRPLTGSKSLVLFGWGLGRLGPGGVAMEADYGEARQVLLEARVAVFTLDVTEADYHSLEVGLQQVSGDTGGFYARTHNFPAQAIARLEGALEGYYILTLVRPDLPPGRHRLSIDVPGRGATVLARPDYEG